MKQVETNNSKNNRGIALVSVLIVITLVSILATSILNLSYLAYQRKLVEKRNTENFYANEAVVDTIKAVLQNAAASALSEVDDSDEFAAAAKNNIEKVVGNSVYDSLRDYLFNYVVSTMDEDSTGTSIEKAITSTDDGGNGGYFKVGAMEVNDDGTMLYIRDVEIQYVNDEGYTSTITTDIVIRSPVYASNENNPLGSYSMMCGDGADFEGSGQGWKNRSNQTSYLRHEGNIYIGASMSAGAISSTAATIDKGLCLEFSGDNVVINGDVYVKGGSILLLNAESIEIKGTIYLGDESILLIGPNCKDLVVKDINVDGKSFTGSTGASLYSGGSTTQISTYVDFPLTTYKERGDIQNIFDTSGLTLLYNTDSENSKIAIYDDTAGAYYIASVYDDGTNRYLYYYITSEGNVSCSATKASETDTVALTSSQKILFDMTLTQTPLASDGYDAEVSSRIDTEVLIAYKDITDSWLPKYYVTVDSAVTDVFDVADSALEDDGKLYISTLSSISSGRGSADTFEYLASKDDQTTSTLSVTINIGETSEIVNSNAMSLDLYVCTSNIKVAMNSNSEYCGIYLSLGNVTFYQQGGGLSRGTSFLEMDKSDGYAYAKAWCKMVGYLVCKYQNDWNGYDDSSYTYGTTYAGYYRLVNNIFHGGYAALYESLEESTSSSSSSSVTTDNSDTNFVDTENWYKDKEEETTAASGD